MSLEKQNLRLRLLLEILGITQQEFASQLGITQSAVSQLLNDKSRMSTETLHRLGQSYRIDLNWLIEGIGRPFRETTGSRLPSQPALLPITLDAVGQPNIALVPVRAQAGYANQRIESEFWNELPVFQLPGKEYLQGTYRAFEVEGDSMQPTLAHQDLIVCHYVEDWRWMRHFELYVVVVEGDVLVKRVFNQLREQKRIFLLSDNEFYPPIELRAEDLIEIWAVRTRITGQFLPPPITKQYENWNTSSPPR